MDFYPYPPKKKKKKIERQNKWKRKEDRYMDK